LELTKIKNFANHLYNKINLIGKIKNHKLVILNKGKVEKNQVY